MGYIERHEMQKEVRKDYYYRGTWLQLIRPLTLSGTMTPILVGTGLAFKDGEGSWSVFFVFLVTAVLIQVVVNMLNDYFDFIHGQDVEKWTEDKEDTSSYIALHAIPIVAAILTVIACIGGLWLAKMSHEWIIPVGILSILAGIKYSAGKHAFSAIAMGEMIAFLFLGVVVTILSYVVQTGYISTEIIGVAIVFGLLIATMILTNNIRDIEKDKPFRVTVAILLGRKNAIRLLASLCMVIYISMFCFVLFGLLHWTVLLTFGAIPFAWKLLQTFRTDEEEKACMKRAAYHHLSFGLLLAIAVWVL